MIYMFTPDKIKAPQGLKTSFFAGKSGFTSSISILDWYRTGQTTVKAKPNDNQELLVPCCCFGSTSCRSLRAKTRGYNFPYIVRVTNISFSRKNSQKGLTAMYGNFSINSSYFFGISK